jgi:formate/nitrite transporter FocA (FNT family)
MLRLWSIVLVANLTGAHIERDVTPPQAIPRGIFAGWLIPPIVIMTYFVGLGRFTHIIAGSIEALFLVCTGAIPWMTFVTRYMLPTLLGNCLGDVLLVAVLNHAQVWSSRL